MREQGRRFASNIGSGGSEISFREETLENDVESIANAVMKGVFLLSGTREEMVTIGVSAFATGAKRGARVKGEAQFATKSRVEKGRCILKAGHMKRRGSKGQRGEVGAE